MTKDEIQKQALEAHASYNYRSTIAMSMGLGKTKLSIDRIHHHLTQNPDSKIIVSGARLVFLTNFKLELAVYKLERYIPLIEFKTTKSLKNCKHIYDLIIIDECHKEPANTYSFLKEQTELSETSEIICLTGTPKRFELTSPKNFYLFAPISFVKTIDDSIEDDLLNNYTITVILTELEKDKKTYASQSKKSTFYTSEQKSYEFWIRKYNETETRGMNFALIKLKQFFRNIQSKDVIINKLLNKYKNEKTLVFLSSIDKTYQYEIPSYHSKLDKNTRSKNLLSFINSDILHLTNVEGLVESVNIPHLKNIIITRIDASPSKFWQTLGRGLRLNINETANVIILCTKNTIEVEWLRTALKNADRSKIKAFNTHDYDFTPN